MRRRPYSVLLFDEIEKAHPDVFNILLQILEDGRLTDGKGRKVDFRNTVLVMTSNVGSTALFALQDKDPERARKEAHEALRAAFRPEFLNRVDDIVLFNPLGREQLEKIVDLQLAAVATLLASRNVRVELTPAARSAGAGGRLRSGLRRAAAAARGAAAGAGPAGDGDSRRPRAARLDRFAWTPTLPTAKMKFEMTRPAAASDGAEPAVAAGRSEGSGVNDLSLLGKAAFDGWLGECYKFSLCPALPAAGRTVFESAVCRSLSPLGGGAGGNTQALDGPSASAR